MRATKTGVWLTVVPDRLNGMELSEEEIRDNLRLCYGLTPLNVQTHCNGYGKPLTVDHALSCAHGRLVLMRHNDTCGEFGDLSQTALMPSWVSYKPLIHTSRADSSLGVDKNLTPVQQQREKEKQARLEAEDGEITLETEDATVQVPGEEFWKRGTTSIFDVRITNLDTPSHQCTEPEKVLTKAEKEKKKKYLDDCLQRRRTFTPLVYLADGMTGDEVKAAERCMASHLSNKLKHEYLKMCGFVRVRMALAIICANTFLLRGPRDKSGRIEHPVFDDGAGLSL
eukprot:4708624-Ditylum_brightwellii.AAC.1